MTIEQGIQLMKEIVTALLGLVIVGYTLVIGWRVFSYVGDQQKMSDAKDILLLMLGLAGVVIGYYFGRVPADARATQSQQQADSANAHAEQVSVQAGAAADQVDAILTRTSESPDAGARRAAGFKETEGSSEELKHVRDSLRGIAAAGRRR
jgi:hypothetical protein